MVGSAPLCISRNGDLSVWVQSRKRPMMHVYRHIFTRFFMITLILILGVRQAQAAPLTEAEQRACQNLRHCVSIIERHGPDDFDYDVLGAEFKHFGLEGRAALFHTLKGKNGSSDIAEILVGLGPTYPIERTQIQKIWSLENADRFLPLFEGGHKDDELFIIRTLGHADASIRERARKAFIAFPRQDKTYQISETYQAEILSAVTRDPMAVMAPVISTFSGVGNEAALEGLLLSGDLSIVEAGYGVLYRHNQEKAFNALLDAMKAARTGEQIRALGDMLVRRHKNREDGFYAKFATDISKDRAFPPQARAVGLHVMLRVAAENKSELAEFDPAQIEGFRHLLDNGFTAQDLYASVLPISGLKILWDTAQSERWINRDRLAQYYLDTPLKSLVVRHMILADDARTVRTGLGLAGEGEFLSDIQKQTTHPVTMIANLARVHLDQKIINSNSTCRFANFDVDDITIQMPFFDAAWAKTWHNGRVTLARDNLVAAHPNAFGWLAAYQSESLSADDIGELIYYENESGAFSRIGDFRAPMAILPNRSLSLGETTNQFWLIDGWGGDSFDVSVYSVYVSKTDRIIRHIGAIPHNVMNFGVSRSGDLLLRFAANPDKTTQPPLRISPKGQISSLCHPTG